MSDHDDSYGPLREQAAVLATSVENMAAGLGDVSKNLASVQRYGHRNRVLILTTIASLVLDVMLTVTIAIVASNVLESNHKIAFTSANINCVNSIISGIRQTQKQRSDSIDMKFSLMHQQISILARSLYAQGHIGSAAERRRVLDQYMADITKLSRIPIPVVRPLKTEC
jgi:hypothetical protein